MRRALPFTVLLAAASWAPQVIAAPPASDESSNDKWINRWAPERGMGEVGIYGGIFMPHRQLELFEADMALPDQGFKEYVRIAPEFGLRGGYYPLAFLGVEGEAGLLPTKVQDAGGNLPATMWTARTHLVAQLPRWSIAPFAVAGIGLLGVDSARVAVGSEVDSAIHFGGGVKFFINRYAMLRLDARGVMTNRRGVGDGVLLSPEFLLGFSFTLGRERERSRPGPRDKDGDGILDSKDWCPELPGPEPRGCPVVCLPDDDADKIPNDDDKCPSEPESRNGFEDDDGCPDEVPAELAALSGTMEGIHFDTDKASIKSSSVPVLKKAAEVLRQFPDLRVEISGHTDSRGGYQHNLDLSRRRAESVKAWLIKAGIDGARLETRGAGPNEAIDTNDTSQGRFNNRRIEFKILSTEAGK